MYDFWFSVRPFQYNELVVEQIVVFLQIQLEITTQPVGRKIYRPDFQRVWIYVSHTKMLTWNDIL